VAEAIPFAERDEVAEKAALRNDGAAVKQTPRLVSVSTDSSTHVELLFGYELGGSSATCPNLPN